MKKILLLLLFPVYAFAQICPCTEAQLYARIKAVYRDANPTPVKQAGVLDSLVKSTQRYDLDLSTIGALTPSNDDFLQRKSGAWTNRTIAQVKTDLGILNAPFSDASALVKNSSDNTKTATFSASGITTGTNRTYTLPNANGTLALASTTLAGYGITNALVNGVTNTLSAATSFRSSTGNSVVIDDSAITLQAIVGSQIFLQYGGSAYPITIGGSFTTNSSLNFNLSGPTLVTLPTTGTLSTRAGIETITNKTISGASNTFSSIPASVLTGQVALANGGTNANLSDPGADRLLGWDDTDNAIGFWTIGTGLTYTHSTHTLSTSGGTVTSITLTQPSAGLTITGTGAPITTTGTPTFALADDLLALEGLSSTGIAVRTATSTWTPRTITGTTDQIDVTNGSGVSGNPTLVIASTYAGQASITSLGSGITLGTGLSGVSRAITAAGTATDIDLLLVAKNAGTLQLSASGVIPFSIDGSNAHINIGQSATSTRMLNVYENFASTNTIEYLERSTRETNSTAANGIGVGVEYVVETAPSNDEIGALMEIVTTDVTSTSEDFDIVFKTMSAGATAAERFRVSADGITATYQGASISLTGLSQVNETTTSRTLTSADNQHLIYIKNAGSTSVVLPNGMPVGFSVVLWMYESSGTMTLSATTTLRTPGGATQMINDRESCTCWHEGSNIWNCKGDLH